MADAYGLRVGGLNCFAAAWSATTHALDAATDGVAWAFKAVDDITITKVGFLETAEAGASTTWTIGLQSLDATTGFPTGTYLGGGSPASVTFTQADTAANTFTWFTLDNSYACTAGQDLAVVITYSAGTISGAANITVCTAGSGAAVPSHSPYALTNTAGTWAKIVTAPPTFGYASSTTSYGLPQQSALNVAFNSSSSPASRGMSFNLPSGWGSTYKVAGMAAVFGTPSSAATDSVVIKILDTDVTTVLQSVTADLENVAAPNASRQLIVYFDEATLSDLNFGSTYYLLFEPQTTNNITLRGLTVSATAADWDAWPGGQNFAYGTWATNVFTPSATSRLFCDLILADWTEPTGGGGGSTRVIGG
jgi:hypothetical protein